MDDFYLSISQPARAEVKVKNSRFIAETTNIEISKEALALLEKIRKREHAASHHCYAYRIGMGQTQEFKYSDDGEPNGTAGKPIFDCLSGRNLTNVITIVTRYFGGTKLGTGGLARAYSDAAKKALDKSGTKTVYLTDSFTITIDFKHFDQLQRLFQRFEVIQSDPAFGELARVTLSVRKSRTEELKKEIINLTHGQAKIE
jgi:uncharacterized YigZ family protein